VLVAAAVGGEAGITPEREPLMVSDFLQAKGLRHAELRTHRGLFGKVMKRKYREATNLEPSVRDQFVDGAWAKGVACYAERYRPLMEEAWSEYVASLPVKEDSD
jgi:hypothetical protein